MAAYPRWWVWKSVPKTDHKTCPNLCAIASKTSPLMFVPAVTSERGPGGDNLTLTCVLTCSKDCSKDFNLTWSEGGQASWQSGLLRENNTLMKRIFVPVLSTASDELTCTVRREGAVVASKKWHTVSRKYASCYCCLFSWIKPEHKHTCFWFRMTKVLISTALQTPAWLALPLGLLICIAAGGLWVYMKRKHNKDAGTESGLNVGNVRFCKPRIWQHFTFGMFQFYVLCLGSCQSYVSVLVVRLGWGRKPLDEG